LKLSRALILGSIAFGRCLMDREQIEQQLVLAERHFTRGEMHIARQIEINADLERDGHDATIARQLLASFEATQALHIDRDRLLGERRFAP
jgi:hypothetical protein